jgi:acetyl-CoA acetyltransferase
LEKEDYQFYREAVQHVASSLVLPQAMLSVYAFLKQYFPLAALSFHKFEKHLVANRYKVTRADQDAFAANGSVTAGNSSQTTDGAIALGHLLANMQRLGVRYGVESMCIGGAVRTV